MSCANRKSTTAVREAVLRKGPMERRLAAIVCADIAGYARLMGADEAGTHASFKAHRSAIYPIILNHGGRLVKNTGDGFLLEFASIVGAIEAAIAMQTVMAERNHHLPADRVMHFRMGVHMGDVMADEDEVFGDDVNIAVRLETVAAPGGIAVSDKAYTEVGKRLSVTLADTGRIASRISQNRSRSGPGRRRARCKRARFRPTDPNLPAQYRTAIVGVLPFDNLSDSADEYFSDGLTEDLIHALSLQSFYRVLSRSSTFAFRGKNLSTRLIAREIDATYLIQGSVRRSGSKIRVTAELIAPETASSYGPAATTATSTTCSRCRTSSRPACRRRSRRKFSARKHRRRRGNSDLTAWDRFLKGLSHYYRETKEDFEASIEPVQAGHRARSQAFDRARLSRHHHGAGRPLWVDPEHAANCGPRRWSSPKAASGSTRARPLPSRSSPTCT